ncbi:Flp family type IVb pilin [Nocardioides humilatus]|uniref:Flp family type IVb pilin n=1 Tax=Nocardioides humilatus TaxID=2607660 RepID=A0A5B1LBG4_9ACTN|nr:Flp family type IVb pilin [Nocardioides humilatus]KAA1417973.1 Flp family type IVb pilin [Nocardioides humilatus]KAA1417975.1 Flp family type IVb pilin [Nocardioides humilatus]
MIQYLQILLNAHRDEERGASAVEYGLLVALIAVVMAVGAAVFGTALNDLFNSVAGQI